MPRSRTDRKLSRWEVLGAWTRLWTPPRDVDVPPIPWRALGIGAFVALVLAVLVVTLGIPAVTEHNHSADEREHAADQAGSRARLRRLAALQVSHRAAGRPATDVSGRQALVRDLEAKVLIDARARARVHEDAMKGPIRRVQCRPGRRSGAGGVVPENELKLARAGYDCTAVTNDITGHSGAVVGYPFKGVIDFRTGALVWCRTNPPPGEQVATDPSKIPELPQECHDPS